MMDQLKRSEVFRSSLMPGAMKTCANCRYSFPFAVGRSPPKYLGCGKAQGAVERDLAELMRKGACGAEATLWEARDGQA